MTASYIALDWGSTNLRAFCISRENAPQKSVQNGELPGWKAPRHSRYSTM